MAKVNPIKGNWSLPSPKDLFRKGNRPLAGNVVPAKPINTANTTLPTSPRAGAVRRPSRMGRNILVTAALALVTLAVAKGLKDYNANHRAENVKEAVK